MDNIIASDFFARPMEMDNWKWAMENHIGLWVEAKGKSFWEVVRHVSISRGVLKDISRENFGKVVLKLCPSLFTSSVTPLSLKYDMDKFRYNRDYSNYDKLPDAHILRKLEAEVHALLDMKQDHEPATSVPTIESRLGDYLYELKEKYVNIRIKERPTYCNCTATFSMEQYMSRAFYNLEKPSQIMVFECVNDKVNSTTVAQLAGQYMPERKIKLFIVSNCGFDTKTYSMAETREVGLIKIDPKQPMDDSCFVLWRSGDSTEQIHSFELMLEGKVPMSVPMIIVDGNKRFTSFTRMLIRYGFLTAEPEFRQIHTYTHDEIEHIAYSMVKDDTDNYVALLKDFDYNRRDVPYLEINPYQIARKRGIKIRREKSHNLAKFNVRKHEVTLNKRIRPYSERERFSMGHEIGHDELHVKCGYDNSINFSRDERVLMESEANYFASCLLMPREPTRLMYEIYWKKEFHDDNVKPLTVNKDLRYKSSLFQRIIGPASRHLNVSMDALMYRLHDMGMVVFS